MQEFCEKYKDTAVGTQLDDVISVAGRIYAMRASGAKLVFYDLRAEGAKIQIMANMAAYKVRSNRLKAEYFELLIMTLESPKKNLLISLPKSAVVISSASRAIPAKLKRASSPLSQPKWKF